MVISGFSELLRGRRLPDDPNHMRTEGEDCGSANRQEFGLSCRGWRDVHASEGERSAIQLRVRLVGTADAVYQSHEVDELIRRVGMEGECSHEPLGR